MLLPPFSTITVALEIPADLKRQFLKDMDPKPRVALDGDAPDNSLDPAKYLIGGGDAFQISIVGLPSESYTPVVDAGGNLYDGELGLIPLGKIPLSEAMGLIQEKVKKTLRKNNQVYVALRKIKKASITLTGAISVPGTYQLPGSYRLLDAIKAANGGALPALSATDLRKVTVRNGDSARTFDLMRFISKQDLDQNPYIYPGDNIYVNHTDSRVYVSGEILEPMKGWVPMIPGETMADFISVLNLKHTADSSGFLVQQASSPSSQSLKRLSMQETAHFTLNPNDLITVTSKESYRRSDTVLVAGEVKNPGTYPILFSRSSLKRLLELAGGATERGNLERLVVIRHRKSEEIRGKGNDMDSQGLLRSGMGKSMGTLQSVRPEISSSITDLHTSSDYTLIENIDLEDEDLLQDGDEIFVPRKDKYVYVSGSVKKPGAYRFVKDAGISHYIKQADGYANNADPRNQFLLANYDGVTQIKGGRSVSEGDLIVVPAAVEYKRVTSLYFPALQVLTGILSLALTLMILNRQE